MSSPMGPFAISSSPPMGGQGLRLLKQRSLSKGQSMPGTPVVRAGSAGQHDFSVSRRESSDGGQGRRLDFSLPRTPPVFASAPATSTSRPPVPAARETFVGFDVPRSSDSGVAAESGLTRQPSLLSRALSGTLSAPAELYGSSVMPSGLDFSQMVVVPSPREQPPPAHLVEAQARFPVFRSPMVITAYHTAARAHAGQMRRNGESVLAHCLETALLVADLGLPAEHVAAALLHEVLSGDAAMSETQLAQQLPGAVVELVAKVEQLSGISQTYRDNTHTLEAATILDMLTSMSDVGAVLIKLADRLHNMRTIEALPRCKQVRMANETLDVFAPLANRFGAWSMRAELEDLCFKTLHPDEYAAVAAAVAARAGSAADANAALGARMAELQAAFGDAQLEIVDMSGRAKNLYGIWRKLQRNGGLQEGQQVDLDGIWDVLALRVVVPHKHDCFVAYRVVQQLWAEVPGRCKDYIHRRKGNGYQSLHTTVVPEHGAPFEVQIRTPKMHYIAEYGFAAHWRYKEQLDDEDLWLERLVNYKKWVAAEQLGIRDKKVRVDGSTVDRALASLGVGAAAGSPEKGGFSADGSPSKMDPFLSNARLRPQAVSGDGSGASVFVASAGGALRTQKLPPGFTAGQLAGSRFLTDAEQRGCEVWVNGAPAASNPDAVLRPADRVQMVLKPVAVPAQRQPSLQTAGVAAVAAAAAVGQALREPALAVGAVGAGVTAAAGELLDVYLPGMLVPVEVSMEQKLKRSTMELRSLALVS